MMRDLLDLPDRTAKPRQDGITHVLDKGLSVAEVDGMVEVAGASVDIVKLGWGTALATENLDRKLARFREHGIPVVLGGTLTELAIARGRLDELIAWGIVPAPVLGDAAYGDATELRMGLHARGIEYVLDSRGATSALPEDSRPRTAPIR